MFKGLRDYFTHSWFIKTSAFVYSTPALVYCSYTLFGEYVIEKLGILILSLVRKIRWKTRLMITNGFEFVDNKVRSNDIHGRIQHRYTVREHRQCTSMRLFENRITVTSLPSSVFSNISCSSWNVGIVTPQLSPNRSQKANIAAKLGSDAHASCASATGGAAISRFSDRTVWTPTTVSTSLGTSCLERTRVFLNFRELKSKHK